jgi:hypothetical protein
MPESFTTVAQPHQESMMNYGQCRIGGIKGTVVRGKSVEILGVWLTIVLFGEE